MELVIHPEIERRIARWPNGRSAMLRLGELKGMASSAASIPEARFKRSGKGHNAVFEPYLILGLHHAKLDNSGGRSGDPLLVFQETEEGTFVAIAVARHADYATSVHPKCRKWLWEHRNSIRWDIEPRAEDVLHDLEREFGNNNPGVGP